MASSISSMHPNKKTKEHIRVLASCGASLEFMSNELGIDEDTIEEDYGDDIRFALEEANSRVALTFLKMATSGDHPQMTMAWLKIKAGWVEPNAPTRSEEEVEAENENARQRLAALLKNRPEVVQALKKG